MNVRTMTTEVRVYGLPTVAIARPENAPGIVDANDSLAYLSVVAISMTGSPNRSPDTEHVAEITIQMPSTMANRLARFHSRIAAGERGQNCAGLVLNVLGHTEELFVDPDDAMTILGERTRVSSGSPIVAHSFAMSDRHRPHHFALGISDQKVLSIDGTDGPLLCTPPSAFLYGSGVMFSHNDAHRI